ncbi:hypothetical protein G6F42_025710 [Rhizopus arrhizus]|nr:hypothetical protein G6F42_025710 [Rhizopus arrhizus]
MRDCVLCHELYWTNYNRVRRQKPHLTWINAELTIYQRAVADVIGKLNSLIIFSLTTAIACLLIWPFASIFPALMAFSVVFGIGSGTYFVLMSPVTAEILGMDGLQTGLSVLIFANALSTFGPTVATAIEARANAAPFFTFKMFTGACYLAGVSLLMVLKLRINTNIIAKV